MTHAGRGGRLADSMITRVELLRSRGPVPALRVRIHMDRGEPLEVALEALERLSIGVGDALPPNRKLQLLDADSDVRIRDAALNLLSFRARTRAELRRKLLTKGFPAARIDPGLDRLEACGLVDDTAVAAAFVRDRLRHRPRGKVRLSQELRTKGIDGDIAQRVIDEVLEAEEVTETDLAHRVVDGWIRRQGTTTLQALASSGHSAEREKARRRLQGYLVRRGFRGAALVRATEMAVETLRA